MNSDYIERRGNGYYVSGVRVSLDSIVYAFNEGQSPEAIQGNFPVLNRAQIENAIAFYLDHQTEVDQYLANTDRQLEMLTIPMAEADPGLWEKVQRARASRL
jgi:uncharacterized protein (DUF433 family)